MEHKYTVTVGIPAHNEEANIKSLLKDVLKQNRAGYTLEKIVIVADGCTDNTIEEIKKIKTKKIQLLETPRRAGLAHAQNLIVNNTNSDVLILLNADVRIKGKSFFEKMILPIMEEGADLVASSVQEAEPKTYFEKILFVSTQFKNDVYEKFENGNNVYTCRGVARAFSKKLYKRLHFHTSVGEDAYSYFYCIANNFKYFFARDAKVVFRLPNNYMDHKKQSVRFFNSQALLKKEFGTKFVTKSYHIGKKPLIISLVKTFAKHPILTFSYIAILSQIKINSLLKLQVSDHWEMASSSKTI